MTLIQIFIKRSRCNQPTPFLFCRPIPLLHRVHEPAPQELPAGQGQRHGQRGLRLQRCCQGREYTIYCMFSLLLGTGVWLHRVTCIPPLFLFLCDVAWWSVSSAVSNICVCVGRCIYKPDVWQRRTRSVTHPTGFSCWLMVSPTFFFPVFSSSPVLSVKFSNNSSPVLVGLDESCCAPRFYPPHAFFLSFTLYRIKYNILQHFYSWFFTPVVISQVRSSSFLLSQFLHAVCALCCTFATCVQHAWSNFVFIFVTSKYYA